MHSAGMICELNPFHNGHAYLLKRMRATVGEDGCTVCLMSGRFVQRGIPAVADPYLRAKTALDGGADLVLELPFPWSAASAEHFALAGVRILSRLGVENLSFGSECGDESLLSRTAALLDQPAFRTRFAERCRSGTGTALAYAEALRETADLEHLPLPDGFPSSNDLLGIAYLRAIAATDASLRPQIVERRGDRYNDTVLNDAAYPSATALRALIHEAAEDPVALRAILDGTMPEAALDRLLGAVETSEMPLSEDPLLAYCLCHFRLHEGAEFADCAEMGGGLSNYIVRSARESATPAAFMETLRTKQFTDARLRRAMLYAVTDVTLDDLRAEPSFTTVLAANRRGCRFLREITRREAANAESGVTRPPFAVITKPSAVPDDRNARLAARADALFTLCFPHPLPAAAMRTRTPYIDEK